MKNLFSIIMLFSSIHLFSADHPWAAGQFNKKAKTKSYSDSTFPKHTQLNDEQGETLSFDPQTDALVKKHEKMIERVRILRSDIKNTHKKSAVTFSCNIQKLQQQLAFAIEKPIDITPEARVAKREQRIATLKQTQATLLLVLQGFDKQSDLIKRLLLVIDELCPDQK